MAESRGAVLGHRFRRLSSYRTRFHRNSACRESYFDLLTHPQLVGTLTRPRRRLPAAHRLGLAHPTPRSLYSLDTAQAATACLPRVLHVVHNRPGTLYHVRLWLLGTTLARFVATSGSRSLEADPLLPVLVSETRPPIRRLLEVLLRITSDDPATLTPRAGGLLLVPVHLPSIIESLSRPTRPERVSLPAHWPGHRQALLCRLTYWLRTENECSQRMLAPRSFLRVSCDLDRKCHTEKDHKGEGDPRTFSVPS